MEQLQRTITLNFKIGAVDRSFTIAFPKVGQYMAVECRKAELSSTMNGDSQYLNLVRTSTKRSFFALDLVDMSAWFEVLIPDLMKDSVGDLKSIEQLDIFDAKPLLDVYKKTFAPWREAWEKVLMGEEETPKTEDKNA